MKRCPKCNFSFVNFHHLCDFDGAELVDDPETLPVSPAVSALAAATRSPFLRLIKSPVFFTVLGLAGVLASLLVIVYYDAASQPNSFAKSQAERDSPDSISSLARPAQLTTRPSTQPPTQPSASIATRSPSTSSNEVGTRSGNARAESPANEISSRSEIGRPKPAKASSRIRVGSITASRAGVRPRPAMRKQQSNTELALQRQPKDKPLQKESNESALQRDAKENAHRKESKLTAALKTTWTVIKKPFKF